MPEQDTIAEIFVKFVLELIYNFIVVPGEDGLLRC